MIQLGEKSEIMNVELRGNVGGVQLKMSLRICEDSKRRVYRIMSVFTIHGRPKD